MRHVVSLLLVAICAPSLADDSLAHQSIAELAARMQAGKVTAESLVRYDLDRIHLLDQNGPTLRSVVTLNPDAVAQAKALDEERRAHGVRGPLHGIPVLIKDSIETADRMPTTAGSLALAHNQATRDAPVVAALRAAGAVILGKTNLSEWSNYRSEHSISGWSAVGGLTKNPYVLDRSPSGSSSGSAVALAAGLSAAALGAETDGSVTSPAAINGVVGLKPTRQLLPQQGIVPIAASQDTAGPMARSVGDVAILLTEMVRHLPGPCPLPSNDCASVDYSAGLTADWLRGKRIGVLRFTAGLQPVIEPVFERALAHLRAAGATLFEVEIPDLDRIGEAEQTVLLNEFKTDINAYLASAPDAVLTRNLQQLIDFNRASPYELELFGQDLLVRAQQAPGTEDPAYREALQTSRRMAGVDGIDRMLKRQQLDLLVAPTVSPAWRVDRVNGDFQSSASTILAAVAGYPHLTVPMGQVQGLPLGLSFIGPAWSEASVLAAGFAYESREPGFVPPKFLATLESPASPAFAPHSH
jgi:amidase